MSDDRGRTGLGLSDFLSIGSYNVVCLVAGLGLGWWLDDLTGTTPLLTLAGIAGGIAVGVLGSWLRIRPLLRDQGRADG